MLRASYSFSRVRASAKRAAISFASDSVNTSLRVSFADIQAGLEYINLEASYLVLAESLNRYFTDSFSVAELTSLTVTKIASDSFGMTELLAQSVTKAESDSFGVTEVLSKFVDFSRAFTDTASIVEVSSFTLDMPQVDDFSVSDAPALAPALSKNDAVSFLDEQVFTTGLSKIDSVSFVDSASLLLATDKSDFFTFSDQPSLASSLIKDDSLSAFDEPALTSEVNKNDSVSVSDVFSRNVAYARSFADAFAIDDLASIGDLSKDALLDKGNVFGVVDTLAFSAQKSVADTMQMQEALAKQLASDLSETLSMSDDSPVFSSALGKSDSMSVVDSQIIAISRGAEDSIGVSESIDIDMRDVNTTQFNDSVFNALAFND